MRGRLGDGNGDEDETEWWLSELKEETVVLMVIDLVKDGMGEVARG